MSEAATKNEAVDTLHEAEVPVSRTPALEAEHLTRAVVGKVITNDISIQVQANEILAVVEPSVSFPGPWRRTSHMGPVSAA